MFKILYRIIDFIMILCGGAPRFSGEVMDKVADKIINDDSDSEVLQRSCVSVPVTLAWLKIKVKEKLADGKAAKVAVADIKSLLKICDRGDKAVLAKSLQKFADVGCDYLIASVSSEDEILDAEVFNDLNSPRDEQVMNLINRTGEGIIVIDKQPILNTASCV